MTETEFQRIVREGVNVTRDEKAIEAEIQAKGLTAPRLTPDSIDAAILDETYVQGDAFPEPVLGFPTARIALRCLTICVLVLKNGYTVVGKSACASPENYDAELGRKIARDDARRQVWALEGYRLRGELAGS